MKGLAIDFILILSAKKACKDKIGKGVLIYDF
jgi:hypothetical protein